MLNLLHLRYFIDTVRLGSITAAAKENFVSQSAVSQGIKNLEKSLEANLIDHHPNRLKVTSEGERVFAYALEMFADLKMLKESLYSQPYVGRIEFACTHSFALALLPGALKKAQKQYPNLKVNFRLGHPGLIMEMLKKGMVDFGIVLDNEDLSTFHTLELHRGQYCLYRSKSIKDPKKLPYLLSEERMETHLLKKSYKKKFKKEIHVGMKVFSWEVIASLAEEGIGIGFFPDYIAQKRNKLIEYDIGLPRMEYRILAIFPNGTSPSKNIQAFLDFCRGK